MLAQQQQWRRHFTKVFNIQSQFNEVEIMKARQIEPVRHQLAEVPSMDELTNAIGKLKNGKAGGESGILPEMGNVNMSLYSIVVLVWLPEF